MKAIPYLRALRGRLKRRQQYSFFPEFMVTMPVILWKEAGQHEDCVLAEAMQMKTLRSDIESPYKPDQRPRKQHEATSLTPDAWGDFASCLLQTANDRKNTWRWFFRFCGFPFSAWRCHFPVNYKLQPSQFCWEGCQILPFLRFVPLSLLQCWI